MYDKYPEELEHHGILGMKWGVRRYQNKDGTLTAAGKKRYSDGTSGSESRRENRKARKEVSRSKLFDQTVKQGRDKPNISPVEKMAKNVSSAMDDTSKVVNASYRLANANKQSIDLSNMSDAELKTAINRLDLERRYTSLTTEEVSVGKEYVDNIIDIVAGVAGITGSVVGIIALIKAIK